MKEILEKIKKMQVGTKVAVVVLAGVLVAGTTTGVVVHNNNVEKKQQQIIQMQGQDGKDGKSGADGTSSVTQNFSEEEVLIIDEIVEEAIRDYSMDFSKNIAWSDVLSKEDRESLVKTIAGSVSEDLSKKKTAEVKDLLIEMFADEEYLSMTGTTNLSQEVKTDISRAVIEALSSDSTEDRNETYNLLQETLEKVITERIKEASIEYSLSETDITNIKEIIIENLGNVEGEDGYTPVKGEDYFTTEEITSITQTITNNVENYVNNQELATAVGDQLIQDGSITVVNTATPVKGKDYFTTEEINAMSTTIKNNLMYIVAASQAQLESSMEDGNDEVSAMIGTSETTNNTNIYSSENTYKSGDVIVKDGKIYICNTEINQPEEFNEDHWNSTDIVSINNYYNDYFTESINNIIENYEAGISDLDNRLSDDISGLNSKLSDDITTMNTNVTNNMTTLNNKFTNDITTLNTKVTGDINTLSDKVANDMTTLNTNLSTQITQNKTDIENNVETFKTSVASQFSTVNETINNTITNLGNTIDTFKTKVNGDIQNLSNSTDTKITNLTNNLNSSMSTFQTNVNTQITNLSNETDEKIQDLEDSLVTFSLVNNGDGTYTLNITDPTTAD